MSAEEEEHSEPDWITGTFVIRGQCENPECRQAVHGTGDFTVDQSNRSWRDDYGSLYAYYYTVTHLHPAISLMSLPQSVSTEIREAVLRASRVLFADPGLAATALRATVELFLTTQGVSATGSNGQFRGAHNRINTWREVDPANRSQIAELLFAIKWIGNAGTHEVSDVTTTDVLDGARMLDEAFHRLFTGPDIDVYAQLINAAEGPAPRT